MSFLFPTYARIDVAVDYAEGTYIYGINGKKYLDFTSGIGVCNLGHKPKKVYEAISNQLEKYWHVSNLFHIPLQERAAEMLTKASGLNRVFFANSGAEANEGAIKLARKATGKVKMISFQQSFHGRTFATMSATGQEKVKQGFGPMLHEFVHLPYNNETALLEEMKNDVAAVILEVVQGEGGVHVGKEQFLQKVQELCKQFGALLIIDEVQTGIGRTGKPFAFQHFDLKPDIITVAKGLGSGLPVGAVIGKEEWSHVFHPGSHGSTFGGNPISIQSAIATMEEIFQEDFLQEVLKKGDYLKCRLNELLQDVEYVVEVRGLGLMIGIETTVPITPFLGELREKGILLLQAGEKVLRLLPPLTVTYEELDVAISTIVSVLKKEEIFL